MPQTVHHILRILHDWAPPETQMEYDNVGLLLGSETQHVKRILLCLDVTESVAREAISRKADLIVSHHPLIFQKLDRINPSKGQGRIIYPLIQNNIAVIAAHTNLDAAQNGVSWQLARTLGLGEIVPLQPCETGEDAGMGAIGLLKEPVAQEDFLQKLCSKLKTDAVRYSGNAEEIQKVAVCGGAGIFLKDLAVKQEADAFVTADIKYHHYFQEDNSMLLVDVGHYESEIPIIYELKKYIKSYGNGQEVMITDMDTNPMKTFTYQNQSTQISSNKS